METIEISKEKEYGIELVIKNFIKRNPGVVDVRVTNITSVLIFCDVVLKRELIEQVGELKISDRVIERDEKFIYLSTVYYTYNDSDEKTEARNRLDSYEKSLSKELSRLYEKLPKNLKLYNEYFRELSFSFSSFFVV